MYKILLISFLLNSISIFPQAKIEKEYRIHKNNAPKKAIEFTQKISFDRGVKWYREINQKGTAYEVKGRKNGDKFSIKFDDNGTLIDVEKTIRIKNIPQKDIEIICKTLQKNFTKFRVKKIQIQWNTSTQNLIEKITNKQTDFSNAMYEIVVIGKKNRINKKYELLLQHTGKIEYLLPFEHKNTDNLEF